MLQWVLLCLVAAFFLLRPEALDIPYLEHPQVTYLSRLMFDDESGTGDSPTQYYLRGVDVEGSTRSFQSSRDKFDEGRTLWFDQQINVKAAHLPIRLS